jgi:hypothetical protein
LVLIRHLINLIIDSNKIGDIGAISLSEALQINATLTQLSLGKI